MYAWEMPFNKIVKQIRFNEIKTIHCSNNLQVLSTILSGISQKIMVFLTLVVLMYSGSIIDPQITFQIAIYFNTLQIHMADVFPVAIVLIGQTMVTVKRIEVLIYGFLFVC